MTGIILRAVISALGLWLAESLLDGINIDTPLTLIVAGVLLGFVNAVVRPLLVILTLPLTLVTLGLFLPVINAATLGLVALLLPGFHIAGFWSALWGALLVSLVSWIASGLIGPKGKIDIVRRRN